MQRHETTKKYRNGHDLVVHFSHTHLQTTIPNIIDIHCLHTGRRNYGIQEESNHPVEHKPVQETEPNTVTNQTAMP